MRVEEVLNQSPPYVDIDLYASDRPLADAVAANGGGRDAPALALRRPLGNRCHASSSRQPITMPGSIVEDLITLFVVLDPVGSIPIF